MTVPVRGIEESGFFTDASLNVADPSPTKVQIFTFFIIWKSEPEVRSWVAGDGGRHGVPRNTSQLFVAFVVFIFQWARSEL